MAARLDVVPHRWVTKEESPVPTFMHVFEIFLCEGNCTVLRNLSWMSEISSAISWTSCETALERRAMDVLKPPVRGIFSIHPDAKGTGPKCYFKHLIYFKCTFLLWVILHLSRWGVLITKGQRRGPQWISEWNTRLWLASPGRMLAEQTRVNVRLPWFHSSLWLVPKG